MKIFYLSALSCLYSALVITIVVCNDCVGLEAFPIVVVRDFFSFDGILNSDIIIINHLIIPLVIPSIYAHI